MRIDAMIVDNCAAGWIRLMILELARRLYLGATRMG